jgi:hypothetical protein
VIFQKQEIKNVVFQKDLFLSRKCQNSDFQNFRFSSKKEYLSRVEANETIRLYRGAFFPVPLSIFVCFKIKADDNNLLISGRPTYFGFVWSGCFGILLLFNYFFFETSFFSLLPLLGLGVIFHLVVKSEFLYLKKVLKPFIKKV